jgi:prepilin-type N-terminal cleavage/methylation domain-containing protein
MKKAFTMLELIFVLVVIGVLAASIIPRTKTNPVKEASVDLLSKIRYTQHLALVDDKYDSNTAQWYKNRWQIAFVNNTYSIQSNNGANFAQNTLTRSDDINATQLKGLNALTFSGGCANKSIISFDHLGRPLVGSLSATTSAYTPSGNDGELLQSVCTITLTDTTQTVHLDLQPETGYVRIREATN